MLCCKRAQCQYLREQVTVNNNNLCLTLRYVECAIYTSLLIFDDDVITTVPFCDITILEYWLKYGKQKQTVKVFRL